MSSQSVYRLPDSLPGDLEQLRQMTEQFQAGAIPAARYQAFRVPQGVYEQREAGTYMLRARLAAGLLTPNQMRVAADVAETYGSGVLHLTSRQDLQVHGVALASIPDAVTRLTAAGLSTKGGGGNTVRNIAACFQAGVCPDEVFDVTPDAIRLTESLLRDPLSFQLPRKYKIACSGCGHDCAGATVTDLGFICRQRAGEDGFAVYVGGGMGAHSRVGRLLEEFVPAAAAVKVAEAVKRVFDKHGNRKNRHRARLRFLVEDLGFEAFDKLYRAELGEVVGRPLETGPSSNFTQPTGQVLPQKQPGLFSVEIAPPLGVIEAGQLRELADIVHRYGEKRVRATSWQTAVLRGVTAESIAALKTELASIGLWSEEPPILRHMVTCAGASTCRLGICLSRGLAKAIRAALLDSGLHLDAATGELTVHISGCPNSCGRHPIAPIGLFGAARRVNGRLVPHYIVQFGGHVEEGRTRLASGAHAIPARKVPVFLVDFLRAFERSADYPNFNAFLAAEGRTTAAALAAVYARVPDFAHDKNFYFDWDAEEVFSLAGRGPGECGAGVFDLIEVDLASASDALSAGRLFLAAASAARALLVTRGEQADSDRQSLDLFERLFVQEGLVPADLAALINRARQAAATASPEISFQAHASEVEALLAAVKSLYESMGPSLRLPVSTCATAAVPTPASPSIPADATHDFRGMACPLNYVKTKMALGKLSAGQVLAVLLDETGARNVPDSAANDGHEVLSVARVQAHWRVVIRKAK
jgi:sulfite reductase (ferredoxin)